MRVVIDTNVLVSAILFKGKLEKIIELIDQEIIVPCFSPATLQELVDVFHRPKFSECFEEAGISAEEVIEAVLVYSKVFVTTLKIAEGVVRDKDDAKFLACALSCNASYIITGDNDLLVLDVFQKIPIVTPAEFLRTLK